MRLQLSREKNVVCHEINHLSILLRVNESFSCLNLLTKHQDYTGFGAHDLD